MSTVVKSVPVIFVPALTVWQTPSPAIENCWPLVHDVVVEVVHELPAGQVVQVMAVALEA